MQTVCNNNKCNGCMACKDICPRHCITIKDDIRYFNAIIDNSKCIGCKLCEKVCPNIEKSVFHKPIEWYQGWASDDDIRGTSSSGGAASAIIKAFIENGGYVASCLYLNGEFCFDITNNEEECKRFAGSKYVKSCPEGIYNRIQERLKTDKVLFIGLSCQVAALKNYIKEQVNLYTVDLVCHGTPSPKLLYKYLEEKNIIYREAKNLQFRNKTSFGLSLDGKRVCKYDMDDYLITFLDSIDYTDNCYSCEYAQIARVSDITLGDSWGTEYTEEESRGISLILITTKKGKELVNKSNLLLKEVDINKAIRENHQLEYPSELKPNREKFLNMIINGKSFVKATFYLYKKKILKRNIKKMLIDMKLYRQNRY